MNSVMRRCGAILIALIVLFGNQSTVAANNHEETTENKLYEVLTRSNLRDAPSIEGGWIVTIPGGAFVMLLGDENAEYNYVSYEGMEGYIYSGCIKKAEAGTEPLEVQNSAEPVTTHIPTIPATVIEYSQPDTNSTFLVAPHTGNSASRTEVEETVSAPGTVIMTGNVLTNAVMRAAPSAEGTKMLTISGGSQITYLDAGENGYIHINYQGQDGYVYGRCVELADGTEAGAASIESTVVVTQAVNAAAAQPIVMGSSGVGSSTGSSNTSSSGIGMNSQNISAAMAQRQENSSAAVAAIAPQTAANATASTVQTTTASQAVEAQQAAQQSLAQSQTVTAAVATAVPQTTQSSVEATITPNSAADPNNVSYQISARANMRRDPTQSSEKLTTLPIGANVVLLGQSSGGYTMVQYDGMVGYVLENCVTDAVDLSKIGSEPVLFTVTGYCPCRICCGNYSPEVTGRESRTATGTIPTPGHTIAVDPTVIPYGTRVEIEGMGTYVAEDCGGMVRSNHIDIYFDNHQDALNFGSRRLYVTFVQ